MMRIIRSLAVLVPLIACLEARAAGAQAIAFPGIGWNTPVDSLQPRLEAMGLTPGGSTNSGDPMYEAADGTRIIQHMGGGRLIGFSRVEAARGDGIMARYRALADSLQAARGAPDVVDEEDERQPKRVWVYGLASVAVEAELIGTPWVRTVWRGPGWFDVLSRLEEMPAAPAGFTAVNLTSFMRIAVDTTVRPQRGAATFRGRFRLEYRQAITPSASDGRQEDPIDVAEYEMEFDCAGRRTRLISRSTFLEGRPVATYRPRTQQPWAVPQPDGHYDRGMQAVCRAARGR